MKTKEEFLKDLVDVLNVYFAGTKPKHVIEHVADRIYKDVVSEAVEEERSVWVGLAAHNSSHMDS